MSAGNGGTRRIETGYLARVEGEGAMVVRVRGDEVLGVELRIFEPPRLFEALLRGRAYALPQDVFDIAPDVLRHRIVLSYEALAQGLSAEQILARLLSTVPAPRIAPTQPGGCGLARSLPAMPFAT